ncbi:methionine aminotransferase [Altibacter sp. HG106]|uniref:methionine aminotransferase n=1 Tax=Altibacter sp. HG106 TaxID=3023937 RepID=UPI00235081E7|nr:methionine aminotransferase [Altibacter sp. HG106]MDC7995167.1 methionine aminotransferase [Altibacter sp. HG106]
MKIPQKLPQVGTSIFSVMSAMAQEYDALNLSQGFPNFESDPALIAQVSEAMRAGHNQYAPMPGDAGLRQQIAKSIHQLHHKKYDWEQEITITSGATEALFVAFASVLEKGDEVIVFTPAYDSYTPTISLFGATPIAIPLKTPHYRPDWNEVRDALTSRTRMVVINSPHNPTGMVFSKEDMETLQELVIKNDLWVVSDEVYEHIIFDGNTHQSAARFEALSERTFITASFGKTFHNTGWKIGYCAAPRPMMEALRKIHQFTVFSVHHPTQKALAAYLENGERYAQLGAFYQRKRDLLLDELTTSRFSCIPSAGTYYQLLDFSEITDESDVQFAARLTKEHKIATIPTSVFNADGHDDKVLRLCFAKTDETLKKAGKILRSI